MYSNLWLGYHCAKSVRIQSYSGSHFPAFGLNTERYAVSLCIQSECGKVRTRITQNMDSFHAVYATKLVLTIVRNRASTCFGEQLLFGGVRAFFVKDFL